MNPTPNEVPVEKQILAQCIEEVMKLVSELSADAKELSAPAYYALNRAWLQLEEARNRLKP